VAGTGFNVLGKNGLTLSFEVPLSSLTTFQLGGSCPVLISCEAPQQLTDAVGFLIREKSPFILIGGGSNIVVSDAGVEYPIIRYVSARPLIEREGNDVVVSASTLLDDLAKFAADQGLEGVNYTSGIPGTVGGAIVGNAGAFGKQVGDVLKLVTLIDQRKGQIKKVLPETLEFTYRNSNLKQSGDFVVSAVFALRPGDRANLHKERSEILTVRAEKHPNLSTHPCAGSFFRNIEPTSQAGKRQATGWFLDQAGGKSLQYGGAKIFEKHANIIVKSDGCRAQDVYELSQLMAKLAKDKFDLDLVREVRFVGRFNGMPNGQAMIW